MPAHDWDRAPDFLFHAFHHEWVSALALAINSQLEEDRQYYALPEQVAGDFGPDVLALSTRSDGGDANGHSGGDTVLANAGGTALATRTPRLKRMADRQAAWYSGKMKSVAIRHASGHRLVAVLEIVSAGNKSSRMAMDMFLRKARALLDAGVNFAFVDLHRPTPRDPHGVNAEMWGDEPDSRCTPEQPFGCASYVADPMGAAFFDAFASAAPLPELPVFLTPERYVPLELDGAYAAAFARLPAVWRGELAGA